MTQRLPGFSGRVAIVTGGASGIGAALVRAQDVLRGVARNRAVILAPASARTAWRISRLAPGLSARALSAAVGRQ
jgi:NAD(P)-dependent dehydrogenase (short-subunit alcohol dehydrogenase family)